MDLSIVLGFSCRFHTRFLKRNLFSLLDKVPFFFIHWSTFSRPNLLWTPHSWDFHPYWYQHCPSSHPPDIYEGILYFICLNGNPTSVIANLAWISLQAFLASWNHDGFIKYEMRMLDLLPGIGLHCCPCRSGWTGPSPPPPWCPQPWIACSIPSRITRTKQTIWQKLLIPFSGSLIQPWILQSPPDGHQKHQDPQISSQCSPQKYRLWWILGKVQLQEGRVGHFHHSQ